MDEKTFIQQAGLLQSAFAGTQWLDLPPGHALLIPTWLAPSEAAALLDHCLQHLCWERPMVRVFGSQHPIPRRHAFVGDNGVVYRWSGLEQRPQPWTETLDALRAQLARAGFLFNSLLVNHYRDGADGMGWHADNEKEMGENPVVATVSLGQERKLSFKQSDGAGRLSVILPSGSLLLTSGAVQKHWLHQVAKSTRPLKERVSLTFRYINP
jgi:alkylated DNA repair dioxygenase AlkB